jgi:hypothetical protein
MSKETVKKNYGIVIRARTEPVHPIQMDLAGSKGRRIVLDAAKRVIATHTAVIKALAKR